MGNRNFWMGKSCIGRFGRSFHLGGIQNFLMKISPCTDIFMQNPNITIFF